MELCCCVIRFFWRIVTGGAILQFSAVFVYDPKSVKDEV